MFFADIVMTYFTTIQTDLICSFVKRTIATLRVARVLKWMVTRMSCKDCLHRDGCCNFVPIEGTIEEKAEYLYECLKKPCKDFKSKTDFVEVVRCKDCEHWKRVGSDNIFEKDFGECRCEFWADDSWMGNCRKETYESSFCSFGKRKEINNG